MSKTLVLLQAGHSHPTWEDFGPTEWITIVVAGAFAAWVIWRAVMYTLRPGENDPSHIKHSILREPEGPRPPVSSGASGAPVPDPGAPTEVQGR